MRRNHRSENRDTGLDAVWKATAVVFAVGVLVLAAERPIDLTKDVPGAMGTYTQQEPARDEVPLVGVDVPAVSIDGLQIKDDMRSAPHMLAVAPTSRSEAGTASGISLSPTAAAEEPPVATF